ncbi:DUF4148 domain-containing protein [Rugamonas sp.]|uniref:DUF4148 domain-containing protein n=1 Tax=Rugamonas sp. TaxID=1926287 RepID=UPI0025D6F29E|nr:DUF4148 domain-containing protein [Rugamonas sp.]
MNIKHLIATVSLLTVAGFALADGGVTRAQVQAELVQARAAGLIDQNDATYPVTPAAVSHLSRADVLAQVAQARADGSLAISDADYPRIVETAGTLTRAQVKADVAHARAAGQLDVSEAVYPQATLKQTHAN